MYIFGSKFPGQTWGGAKKAYRREPTIEDILIGLAGFEQLFTGWTDPLVFLRSCASNSIGCIAMVGRRYIGNEWSDRVSAGEVCIF